MQAAVGETARVLHTQLARSACRCSHEGRSVLLAKYEIALKLLAPDRDPTMHLAMQLPLIDVRKFRCYASPSARTLFRATLPFHGVTFVGNRMRFGAKRETTTTTTTTTVTTTKTIIETLLTSRRVGVFLTRYFEAFAPSRNCIPLKFRVSIKHAKRRQTRHQPVPLPPPPSPDLRL